MNGQTGAQIARSQLVICAAIPLAAFFLEEWILLALIPLVAGAPYLRMRQQCLKRVRRIEEQLQGWLQMLANALKASPSLGEAIGNSARLLRGALAQELDLMLKEVKLGTPLDQAVLNMSLRIDSPVVSSALATILVGRQTGGDLPKILQESSATLREMARLEGVVRKQTAEGKSQAYELSMIPFLLIGAIHLIDEHWLEPLGETALGLGIVATAVTLWVAAVFFARRILAVDI